MRVTPPVSSWIRSEVSAVDQEGQVQPGVCQPRCRINANRTPLTVTIKGMDIFLLLRGDVFFNLLYISWTNAGVCANERSVSNLFWIYIYICISYRYGVSKLSRSWNNLYFYLSSFATRYWIGSNSSLSKEQQHSFVVDLSAIANGQALEKQISNIWT